VPGNETNSMPSTVRTQADKAPPIGEESGSETRNMCPRSKFQVLGDTNQ
jgi:hypothetical protein